MPRCWPLSDSPQSGPHPNIYDAAPTLPASAHRRPGRLPAACGVLDPLPYPGLFFEVKVSRRAFLCWGPGDRCPMGLWTPVLPSPRVSRVTPFQLSTNRKFKHLFVTSTKRRENLSLEQVLVGLLQSSPPMGCNKRPRSAVHFTKLFARCHHFHMWFWIARVSIPEG